MIDSSRSLGIVITVSTHSRNASSPRLGLQRALLALEAERLGDDGNRERAELAREARDDRRGSRAGAAAEAGGHEDHVGARQRLNERVGVLERRLTPDVRVGPRAEPLGELVRRSGP